ncbi:MAG: hypothetical protein DMG39_06520 [Acidobacteria bacterium]|nr:MAG: hypothetical protein DMG39_06520 [Acidobacteriota bacterium]
MRKLAYLLITGVVLLSLGSGNAFGQATASATLQGTITDPTGAVVGGATVTITSKDQGWARTTTTTDTGLYRFELLPAGFYSLKITHTGFASASVDRAELLVGQTTTLDFQLKPGQVSETIEVSAQAPVVDTEKTQVGLEITPNDVNSLPLNGRDFGNLAYLAPGARPVDSYDPTKNRIAVFGINGSSGRNVNVTVNGIDNKDNTVGGPVMQLPLGAVEEFNISTQRFSAANGRSEGAAVNVITKAGTNNWHGGLYYYDTETALNANDAISKENKAPTPQFSRQQFGGNVGLPIRRDKDFFFFALEREREQTSIPVDATAFKELTIVKNANNPLMTPDPATTIPTPYFDWRYSGRYDHRFNGQESLFVSYSAQENTGDNDQSTSSNDLTAGNFTTNHLIISNATVNSVLTPRLVNALTVGYQYWNNLIDSKNKVPTFTFPGSSGTPISFGTNTNVPQQSIQKKWQLRDDLSIIKGHHSFKTGFDYVWEPELGGFFEFNPTLEIDFFDDPSVITTNTTKYPQGFATPGAVSGMSDTAGDPHFFLKNGAKMLGLYFQDDWKVSRKLTLNLGLRWDKDFNLIGGGDQGNSRTYQELLAIGDPHAASLPHDDNKDFSPRVGFAYDLTGKGRHILRAGYGFYFGQTFENIPLFMLQQANATIFNTTFAITGNGPGQPCSACTVPGTNIPLSQWQFGVDPMPTNPPPASQLANGAVGRLMDPKYRNPYSEQWNAGFTWALGSVSAIEVDYIHELAIHESKTININPVDVTTGTRPLSAAFSAKGLPVPSRIDNEEAIGRSRYDGLNVAFRRRLSHHLSINSSYVLSRGLAYKGNAAAFRNRPSDPRDPFNPIDFGPVPTDERHRFVFSGVFEVPGGVQLAPIFQAASARPYDGIEGSDVLGIGSGRGNYNIVVPTNAPSNYTWSLTTVSPTTGQTGLTNADLRDCLFNTHTCRAVGFDKFRGSPFVNMDLRTAKNIELGEKMNLQLLAQFFDLFNRANFGNNFGGNIRSSQFLQHTGFITPSGVIVPKSFRAEFGAEFRF